MVFDSQSFDDQSFYMTDVVTEGPAFNSSFDYQAFDNGESAPVPVTITVNPRLVKLLSNRSRVGIKGIKTSTATIITNRRTKIWTK